MDSESYRNFSILFFYFLFFRWVCGKSSSLGNSSKFFWQDGTRKISEIQLKSKASEIQRKYSIIFKKKIPSFYYFE